MVLLHHFLVICWIDELEPATILLFEFVSLYVLLLFEDLPLLKSHAFLALESSLLKFCCFLPLELLLLVEGEVEQANDIAEETSLYLGVQRCVTHKARRMVHLDDPWLQHVVQEDVESKDLEAH